MILGIRRKVPFELQLTASECGLACVAMICRYNDIGISVSDLRKYITVGRDGASAQSLINLMQIFGISGKGFRIDTQSITDEYLPAIAHWNNDHYVVIERRNSKYFWILDPEFGRTRISRDEFSEKYSRVIITAKKINEDFRIKKDSFLKKYSFIIKDIFSASPWSLAGIFISSIFVQLLFLLPAIATKSIIDHLSKDDSNNFLSVLSVGVLLSVACISIATIFRSTLINYLNYKVDNKLMSRFFNHLIHLPYDFFMSRASGDLLLRLNSNSIIRSLLSSQMTSLFIDVICIIFYMIAIIFINIYFGIVVLGSAIFQTVLLLSLLGKMRELSMADISSQAKSQGVAVNIIQGIDTIKSMGSEDFAFSKWYQEFKNQLNNGYKRSNLDSLIELVITFFRNFVPFIVLFIGAFQVKSGQMSLGSLVAVNTLSVSLLSPLAGVIGAVQQLQTVGVQLDRIKDILDLPQEDAQGEYELKNFSEIKLENIDFRYSDNSPLVLKNISMHIYKGEKIALVGKSGSGKSTLARLLLGMFTPVGGKIIINGKDSELYDKQSLRSISSMVPQNSALFDGSIYDNIIFGNGQVTDEKIIEASRMASIHQEIMSMPMSYRTPLSEGEGLSGGQKQRVAIARALVRSPQILLLDEATSDLDTLSEKNINKSIALLGCTRIVIAHRLSSVVDADRIYVLEKGKICCSGKHDDLLSSCAIYASLVSAQQ